MSRHPSRPALWGAAAVAVAGLGGAAALPAVASAEIYGGGYAQVAKNKRNNDIGNNSLMTVNVNGTGVRINVYAITRRCTTLGTRELRTTIADPASFPALNAVRTVRGKSGKLRTRVRLTVQLLRTGPDQLDGTLTMVGTLRNGKRRTRCRGTLPLTLRRNGSGPQPGTAGNRSRFGITSERIGGFRAPIAIVTRPDGRLGAVWATRIRCQSGRKAWNADTSNLAPPFTVRPDGSFRGNERLREQGGRGRNRYRYRFNGTIRGRIGSDGLARGTVRISSRVERRGYYPLVCKSVTARFVAAP
ncbi:hypothetical protein [Patulibacter defluvii]|uniref:hypothetical protein n=1 Tax=Patulibacter defluvii TaxID=3095358 RepID=UPI002A7517F9|nr:hypothetical protein [Patulibacter sp. DM4]